jgi:hypothetical protein
MIPEGQSQRHCESHAAAVDDCGCCPAGLPAAGDCAAYCMIGAALPIVLLSFAPVRPAPPVAIEMHGLPGPDHLPLHPPPIS